MAVKPGKFDTSIDGSAAFIPDMLSEALIIKLTGRGGFAILTAANALTLFMVFLSYFKRSETLWAQSEFLNLTINFFVPILLWFALVPSSWQRFFRK